MKASVLALILMLGVVSLSGQTVTVTGASHWSADEQASDVATVQSYTWLWFLDGATTGTVLPGVTCAVAASGQGFTCTGPIPAVAPGAHTVVVEAQDAAGSSAPSNSVSFTMLAVPAGPINFRFQ